MRVVCETPTAGPGVPGPAVGSLLLVQRATSADRCEIGAINERLALVAAAATLGLAALGAVLFLDANEAETTSVLANNARTLDAFCEPAEKLLKAFRITDFNSHALNHHL
jgi:hypothetical protein